MTSKIKTCVVPITTQVDNIILKGKLEFWAKDYCLKMIEPFEAQCSSHLQYGIPVKFVLEKSKNSSCIEISLLDRSKEMLKTIYLNKKKKGCRR